MIEKRINSIIETFILRPDEACHVSIHRAPGRRVTWHITHLAGPSLLLGFTSDISSLFRETCGHAFDAPRQGRGCPG